MVKHVPLPASLRIEIEPPEPLDVALDDVHADTATRDLGDASPPSRARRGRPARTLPRRIAPDREG